MIKSVIIDGKPYSEEIAPVTIIDSVSQQIHKATRVEAEAPGEYEVKLGNLYIVSNGWYVDTLANYSGGKELHTYKKDDYIEVTFYGNGITVIGTHHPAGGTAEVVIDGVIHGTINQYASTLTPQIASYSIAGLQSGKHVLSLRLTVSGNKSLFVDCFDITNSALLTLDNKGSAEADVQLLVEPAEKETHADYLGKVAGSTVANKHVAKWRSINALGTPDTFNQEFGAGYSLIQSKDGYVAGITSDNNGYYSHQLFSYALDTSLTDIDKLRSYTKEIDIDYFGYGSGVNNGADNHEAEVLAWNRSLNGGVGNWESQGYAGASFSRASEATVENAVFTEVVNFAGKTAGSTAVCPHVLKYKGASTFDAPSTFNNEHTSYTGVTSADGTSVSYSAATVDNFAQHLFSFDLLTWIRNRFPYIGSIDLATAKAITKKIEWTWVGSGSGEGGNEATLKSWNGAAWANPQTNTAVTPAPLVISLTDMTTAIDGTGFAHALAHSTYPADADTPSIISTDYPQLAVTVDLSTIRANQPRYVGSNHALQFSGEGSGINILGTPSVVEAGFTVEGRLKPSDISVESAQYYRRFFSKRDDDNNGFIVAIVDNGRIHVVVMQDGIITVLQGVEASFPILNVEKHVAVTWDGGNTAKLFVDGNVSSLVASGVVYTQAAFSPIGHFNIGSQDGVRGRYKGCMKDVHLFSVARTPEQIAANMTTLTDTTGLVARYACNEGAGLIVNDSAPKAVGEYPYNGVISGATWVAGNAPPFGKGILIEEGTTNLLTANQSSVETDTSGFVAYGGSTITVSSDFAKHGSKGLKVDTALGVASGFQLSDINVPVSTPYTFSVYLKGSGTVEAVVEERTSTDTLVNSTISTALTLNDTWQRLTVTRTFGATGTIARIYIRTNPASAVTFYADCLQLE